VNSAVNASRKWMLKAGRAPTPWRLEFLVLLTIQYIVSKKPSAMGRHRARMPQDQRSRSGRATIALKSSALQNAFYAEIRPTLRAVYGIPPRGKTSSNTYAIESRALKVLRTSLSLGKGMGS
jgi:hypothetical protein